MCHIKGLTAKEKELDHIIPVVPTDIGFTNIGDFIDGLFCEEMGYQILCCKCHQSKTKLENNKR